MDHVFAPACVAGAPGGPITGADVVRTHGKSVAFVRSEMARRRREERSSRETATAGYDIDREVWDTVVAEQVQGALGALPDDLSRPIELAYFGGHTYREVAQMLEAPGHGGEPDPFGPEPAPGRSGRAGRATGRSRTVNDEHRPPSHE